MRSGLIFWSVLTVCFVQSVKCDKMNSFAKALSGEVEHSHDSWAGHALDPWAGPTGPFNPEEESGWLENSEEDMAWKVGLEILEYCTYLDVHEKSNCMQLFFRTNLLFV